MVYCTPITTGSSSAVSTAERRTQQKAVANTLANRLKCRKKLTSTSLSLYLTISSLYSREVFICLSQFLTVFGSTLLCIRLKKYACQIISYFAIYMFTIVKKVLQTLSGQNHWHPHIIYRKIKISLINFILSFPKIT